MSTWSSANSLITNLGNSLLASARLGLGTIKITRVVARENFEQNISTAKSYTLADITEASIAQEGYILACKLADYPDPEEEIESSLLTVRFSNDDLEEDTDTYNLRQIVVMATLISTETGEEGDEVPYMVSQCDDSADCDVMPARAVNPTSFDYDLYVIHAGVDDITIDIRTEGFVWLDDFNDYKAEVAAEFTGVNNKLNNDFAGKSAETESFTSWTPSYDSSHETWSYTDSTTVTGGDGAERFNVHSTPLGGKSNIAVGNRSAAFGGMTEALGENSFVTGQQNYSNADNDIVSGRRNAVNTDNSAVFGECNEVSQSDNAIVGGYANLVNAASSVSSLTVGSHLINNSPNSAVFGKFNDPTEIPATYAFLIGGGSAVNDRKNILELDWNGALSVDSIKVANILNPDGTPKSIDDLPYIREGSGLNSIRANDISTNVATAKNSTAFGTNNKAYGLNSFVGGENSEVGAKSAFVYGDQSSSSTPVTTVTGLKNKIDANSGDSAIISGSYNEIKTSTDSFIAGSVGSSIVSSEYSQITSSDSVSLKYSTCVNVNGSSSFEATYCDSVDIKGGFITTADHLTSSKIFGALIDAAYLDYCTVIGHGLIAMGSANSHIQDQIVLGKYNVNDSNKLLVIGNGSDGNNRNNAIAIDRQGNIFCNGGAASLNAQIATNTSNIATLENDISTNKQLGYLQNYNLSPIDGGSRNGSGVIDRKDCFLPMGVYYVSWIASRHTDTGTVTMTFYDANDESVGQATITNSTTRTEVSVTLTDDCDAIELTNDSNVNASIYQVMIAETDNQSYVPYAPSNADLYKMIQALLQ